MQGKAIEGTGKAFEESRYELVIGRALALYVVHSTTLWHNRMPSSQVTVHEAQKAYNNGVLAEGRIELKMLS